MCRLYSSVCNEPQQTRTRLIDRYMGWSIVLMTMLERTRLEAPGFTEYTIDEHYTRQEYDSLETHP